MRFDSRSYTHASRVCRVLALCSVLGVGVPYRTVPIEDGFVQNASSERSRVLFTFTHKIDHDPRTEGPPPQTLVWHIRSSFPSFERVGDLLHI